MGSLLPHPPKSESKKEEVISFNKKHQRVFIIKDGELKFIPVTIGSTNGNMTEILNGDIKPGMAVVVDIISSKK